MRQCRRMLKAGVACRWSAAEIYDQASDNRRRSSGQRIVHSGAAMSTIRQHTNNRSMRSINVPAHDSSAEPPAQALDTSKGAPQGLELTSMGGRAVGEHGNEKEQARPPSLPALEQQGVHSSAPSSSCSVGGLLENAVHSASLSPQWQQSTSLSPQQQRQRSEECGTSSSECRTSPRHRNAANSGESDVVDLLESRKHGLTFVLSHCVLRAAQGSSWVRRLLIESAYRTLQLISFDPMNAWANISTDVLDIQITYNV